MSRRAKLTLYTDTSGFLSLECPECGHRLRDFDKYCSNCGTKIDQSPDDFEHALDWLIEKILEMGIELEDIPGTKPYRESVEDLFDSEKIKYVALQEGIGPRSNSK